MMKLSALLEADRRELFALQQQLIELLPEYDVKLSPRGSIRVIIPDPDNGENVMADIVIRHVVVNPPHLPARPGRPRSIDSAEYNVTMYRGESGHPLSTYEPISGAVASYPVSGENLKFMVRDLKDYIHLD